MNIPVVAVVDTNCSPEGVDHVIPGNDDALRAIRLFASRIADAILEGQNFGTEGGVETAVSEEDRNAERETTSEPEIQVADKTWETAKRLILKQLNRPPKAQAFLKLQARNRKLK